MIRSHDDNVWSDISVMTSCHDCHVTSVQSSWHVTSLSPVTEMSISSIQMSSPPPGPHASVAARERGELNWNHLKWSILHYRIWLTIKTTIHWTRVDKKWAPNIFICLRENNKMHILKRWEGDDIHDIWDEYDDCVHNWETMSDPGHYDHVCPHAPLVTCPPDVTLSLRTYLHIVKCYPTGHMRPVTGVNVTTIISRERRRWTLRLLSLWLCSVILTNFKERLGQRRTVTAAWAGPELSQRLGSSTKRLSMCHNGRDIERRRGCDGSPGSMSWHSPVQITSASPPVAIAHSDKYKNIKD